MTTTNEARAAEVIAKANLTRRERRPHADVHIVTQQAARDYARALADAGLLAPDLPESNWLSDGHPRWGTPPHCTGVVEHPSQEGLFIHSSNAHYATPAEARRKAYALLAAANHAEGGAS